MNERFYALLSRYLDDDISREELTELTKLLSGSEELCELFMRQTQVAEMLSNRIDPARSTDAFIDGLQTKIGNQRDKTRFVKAVAERIDVETGPKREVRRLRARRSSRVIRWGTVAACLTIVAGSLYYNWHRSQTFSSTLLAYIQEVSPGVTIHRVDGVAAVVVGMEFLPGDSIVTGRKDTVTIGYRNEKTMVTLGKNATLSFPEVTEDNRSGKKLFLERGVIDAYVDSQFRGERLVVATPSARAVVKGTKFTLAAGPRESRLEVTEGVVAFTSLRTDETIDVAAGFYAVAGPDIALAALPLEAEEKAPPVVATKVRYVPSEKLVDESFDAGIPKSGWVPGYDTPTGEVETGTDRAKKRITVKDGAGKDGSRAMVLDGTGVKKGDSVVLMRQLPKDLDSFVLECDFRSSARATVVGGLFLDKGSSWKILYRSPAMERLPKGRWTHCRSEVIRQPDVGGKKTLETSMYYNGTLMIKHVYFSPLPGWITFDCQGGTMALDNVTIHRLRPEPSPGKTAP